MNKEEKKKNQKIYVNNNFDDNSHHAMNLNENDKIEQKTIDTVLMLFLH